MQYHEYALFQFCKYIIIWYNYNGKKKKLKMIHASMVNVNLTVIAVCLIFFFLHKIMHIHKFIMYRTSYNLNIVT